MTLDTYQALARRTQNARLDPHQRREHALFGLASEVGEILGIYQKTFQGHPLRIADVIGELGDLFWFAAELADVYGLNLDDIAQANIDKLRKRYPAGFDEDASLHREV